MVASALCRKATIRLYPGVALTSWREPTVVCGCWLHRRAVSLLSRLEKRKRYFSAAT
ncbi:hypothetical protein O9929_24110 [Vibrio lentus]|nr:hypothetical protein [Vibrio lentus]